MEYLAKKVVDASSGKELGFVLDYAIDFESFSVYGFFVVDEETEGEYLLRFEDVYAVGDVVLVLDWTRLEFVTSRQSGLLGREVISDKGISLGKIDKLVFDKKRVKILCTNKGEIVARLVGLVGEDCVFLKGKSKKIKKEKPFQPISVEPKVVMMSAEKENFSPEKINLSFKFFAGKLATADVFGYNNERIVLKDEKINKLIFENAKKHNKLNELFFAVKK